MTMPFLMGIVAYGRRLRDRRSARLRRDYPAPTGLDGWSSPHSHGWAVGHGTSPPRGWNSRLTGPAAGSRGIQSTLPDSIGAGALWAVRLSVSIGVPFRSPSRPLGGFAPPTGRMALREKTGSVQHIGSYLRPSAFHSGSVCVFFASLRLCARRPDPSSTSAAIGVHRRSIPVPFASSWRGCPLGRRAFA